MAWVRIDDQAPRNEKLLKAGPAAAWLWVCGLAHCQSQLTDGFISDVVLPMMGVLKGYAVLTKRLVDAGLWHRAEGGYQVHDYFDFNPSRDQVQTKRAEDAARKHKDDPARTPDGRRAESKVSRARVPSHPIPSDESDRADAVLDAFRGAWTAAYGYACSLILKPLEVMQLEQQLAAHGDARLRQAIAAYFAAEDAYVRRAKHPLALWLRDPLKFLAKDAVVSARPKGCRHEPACEDDAAHTKRHLADLRSAAS